MANSNKSRKKYTAKDIKRSAAVKWVATKFNCSNSYVYGVINDTFQGGLADEIKKAFKTKYSELQQVLA